MELKKIVEKGLKCDFHIHSVYSKHKESNGLTGNNTLDKLPVLIKN